MAIVIFFSGIGNEDYDLTSRIVERYKSINLKDNLYLYRVLENSASRSPTILFDPYRHHGHRLIQFFVTQREMFGFDSLDKNDFLVIREFVNNINKPYVEDPSMIHRELAAGFLCSKLYTKARQHAKMAILKNPFLLNNYRTLFYCTRKSILK